MMQKVDSFQIARKKIKLSNCLQNFEIAATMKSASHMGGADQNFKLGRMEVGFNKNFPPTIMSNLKYYSLPVKKM